jgi:DNA polymerase-1
MPEILYLIDGHALAYRTYFALTAGGSAFARWATSSGEPTAGVYGFTSVLLRILEQENPDYLAVAFDTGKTFRHERYEPYKATRAKMPEDLKPQVKRMQQMVDAFNIPRLEVQNYEADDVLGSLAVWASKVKGLGVKIITGDRDLLQLVTPRVVVSLPTQKLSDSEDYFPEDVVRKLGVTPEQVVDYKALVGDTSDNIPGVKGIGEKTAITLLAEYQTLDGIYEHIDQIKGRAQTALLADKENAYMSQDLARIVTDLDIELDLNQARPNRFDPAEVEKLFRELEFRTLIQRLGTVVKKLKPVGSTGQQMALFGDAVAPDVKESSTTGITPHIVDSQEKLNKCVNVLNKAKMIAFDTETTSTNAMQAELVGISLAVSQDEGYYIPVGHLSGEQLKLKEVISALKVPLSDPGIAKIAHNAKFDMLILERVGLPVSPVTFDTMIAEWLINPDSRNLGLKNMAWVKLGYEMTHIEALIGTGRSQITMEAVPIAQAASYAVADAVVTLRLHGMLQKELEQVNALELFNTVEMPLVPILAQMEMNGVALDKDFLENFGKELETSLHDIEYKIYGLVGEPFNINSTQQLSDMLFKRLGLEPPDRSRKTTSGFLSTAAGVLEDMRGQHEVVDLILEYREIAKLKSTYVDSLPLQINPHTGRVHTSFNQTGTVTGRIASSDPNLQNIPTRSELGRKVRFGFVAEPGNLLLAVDYSQIELRIVSHMAQDEAMKDAFRNGQDIHATTAAAIFDVPLEKVTKDQRRHAKAINFGLIYGMSPYGLTRSTDLTLAEAENFVKAYFARFPGVKAYLDGTRKTATERGYVETLLGRRRYFPNLKSGTNFNLRQREEREAINAPIQGTAADIIKLAMLDLPSRLKEADLSAKLLLQVHDELILELPKAELPQTAALVKQVMENAYTLSIPVTTDARSGASWGELEPVEE